MDNLLKLNPDALMAHTNKSLFYMNLGEIEQAEEQKSLATSKLFLKNSKKEDDKKEDKKEEIYKKVLELDPEDSLANYGMGEIFFKSNQIEKAIESFKKVLKSDKKEVRAYYYLGSSYEIISEVKLAKEIYQEGLTQSLKQGKDAWVQKIQENYNKLKL